MCVAIPSKVVEIGDSIATVERFGERLVVSTLLLPDPVALGDYVIVQARSYAVEKIAAAEAQEALALFREWFATAGDADGEFEDPDGVN
jgi:hydrogenase expression/formation protein HypC